MAEESSSKEQMVTLVSRDDRKFEIPVAAAKLSMLVKDAIFKDDDEEDGGNLEHKEVPVVRVRGECLERVCEFLTHNSQEEMKKLTDPLGADSFSKVVDQKWYRDFVTNMSRDMLFELLTAANYMNIKPLLDLACAKALFEVKGKTAKEIREILNLPKLTPEEEQQYIDDKRWIFDEC